MKKRDATIELWRIFCMAAVVFSHVASANDVVSFGWCYWHIPGFLLITGFFSVRFSWRKVLCLSGICYGCYWLTVPFRPWDGICNLLTPHGGWFLPFYIVLMVIAVVLDPIVADREHHRQMFLSMVGLLCFAMIPISLSNPHAQMLSIDGMCGRGLLLMIAIYVLGRLAHEYDEKIMRLVRNSFWLWPAFVVGIICCYFSSRILPATRTYLNPLAIATAFIGFYAFRRTFMRLPTWLARTVLFVSPSMFGVYAVHACCVWNFQLLPKNSGIGAVIVRVAVLFIGSLMVDMVRRGLVVIGARLLRRCKCCHS